MGRDVSRPRVSGLVIPDSRVEWDEGESTVTQAGPRPGIPAPGNDTALALATTGSQSAAGSLDVRTQRGGFASPNEAGFIWKNTSDATSRWKGWDPPQGIHGWDPAVWTDGSTFPEYVRNPHAVSLASGRVVVAAEIRDSGSAPDEYRLEVVIREPTTGEWSRVAVGVYSEAAFSQPLLPCLVLLPNGRLLLFHTRVGSALVYLQMWYSDDEGDTWAFGGVGLNDTSISTATYDVRRMRAAQRNGQVMLLLETRKVSAAANPRNELWQFASDNLGNTFRLVETWNGGTGKNIGGHDVVAHPDGFVVSTVGPQTSANDDIQIRVVGDAFRALSTVAATSPSWSTASMGAVASNAYTRADSALALDEDGTLYVYGLYDDGSEMNGHAAGSVDGGLTWLPLGLSLIGTGSFGIWWNIKTNTDYPRDFCAVAWRGRTMIVGNFTAATVTIDESLVAIHLGGYTSLTQAPVARTASQFDRSAFEQIYVPINYPSALGWTTTVTGTLTLTDGALTATCAAAQVAFAERNPGGSIANGVSVLQHVKITDGGDYTTNRVSTLVRLADGVNDYRITVRMQGSGYRVYDEHAGTQVGATQTVDLTIGAEIRIEMAGDSVRVWHRVQADAMIASYKDWTAGPASQSLTDGGALAANNLVSWGVRVAGAAAATAIWRYLAYNTSAYSSSLILVDGFTNPTDLAPRSYSADPVYVSDGVRILASAGPTYVGDDWTIATRYDYEFRRCLEDPSPRRTFRQTGTTAMTIVLRLDNDLAEDTYLPGSCLAIYVGNSNVSEWVVSAYDEGVGYATLGTATMSSGLSSLQWVHGGGAIRPSTSTAIAAPFWLQEQEFKGATFRVSNVLSLRIASQREGGWRTTGLRPVITLAGYTAAAVGSSGSTGAILPKDGLILVDLKGAKYSKIRLVAAAGAAQPVVPAESYFEVGILKPGIFIPFGQDYAWGRTVTTEHGAELSEADDRTRSSRVRAPVRRVVEIGWTDAVDESQAAADGDPDYVLASWDGEAAAAPASTVRLLEGLVSETDGPHIPVVYVARAPIGGGLRVVNRRDAFVYGRLDADSISRESVQGEEGLDEVVRLTSVQLTEEV